MTESENAADTERPEATLESLATLVEELLGVGLEDLQGTLHPVAVWRRPGSDERLVLRIEERSPRSALDFLLLQLLRARAEVIVTTGKILRDEPDLSYELQPVTGLEIGDVSPALLLAARAELWGLERPPRIAILSSGHGLPLHHPALEGQEAVVMTGEPGAAALAGPARAFGVDTVALDEPSLRAACEWLLEDGAQQLSIEAGPSTARQLYGDDGLVDGISLSTFQEQQLPADLQGGPFLSGAELHAQFVPVEEAATREQESGSWSYQFWRRKEAE